MATPVNNPNVPEKLYGIFCGDINAANMQKLVNNLTIASNLGVKEVHLLFQTWGGFIGDGVFLYNLLRVFPVDVTLYNGGQISSAGVVAYLGAKHRKTAKNALFMIHKSSIAIPQSSTFQKLQRVQQGLILEDARTDAIFRERLKLPDEVWIDIVHHDVNISSEDAIKYGIADEIGDFSPDPALKVFNALA